jgi:uncharacterized protein
MTAVKQPAPTVGQAEEIELPVDVGEDFPAIVPVGIIHGARPGPQTVLITGQHGTELMAQDLLEETYNRCRPAEMRGTVTVVFCLDRLAAERGIPVRNPRDGKNLNRVWPGKPDGSYSERLAHQVWSELVAPSAAVIDLHGGEWDEQIVPFALVPQVGDADLDRRALDLTLASGVSLIEKIDATGDWLGKGTLIAESARAGKTALAIEVGGGGVRTGREREAGGAMLRRMLMVLGHLDDKPCGAQEGKILDHSVLVRAPAPGVLVSHVRPGEMVRTGDVLANLRSFGGSHRAQVSSQTEGVVMLRSAARVVAEGALIAKIGVA